MMKLQYNCKDDTTVYLIVCIARKYFCYAQQESEYSIRSDGFVDQAISSDNYDNVAIQLIQTRTQMK